MTTPFDQRVPDADREIEEELAQLLDEAPSEPGTSDEDVETLLRNTRDRISQERGIRSWLRNRSTGFRIGAGLAIFACVILGAVARTPKSLDAALLFHMAVLGALTALSVLFGFRPLHARPLPKAAVFGLLAAFLLVPAAIAFDTPAGQPLGSELFAGIAKCFVVGTVFALPLAAMVALLSRGGNLLASIALASAAGLGANLWLEAHCPVPGTLHLLGGHVAIVALYAFVTGLALWLRNGRRAPST